MNIPMWLKKVEKSYGGFGMVRYLRIGKFIDFSVYEKHGLLLQQQRQQHQKRHHWQQQWCPKN